MERVGTLSGAGGSVGSDGGFSVERVLHTCHFLPSTAEAWQKKSGGDDYEKRAGIPKTDGADEHLNLAVWPVQFSPAAPAAPAFFALRILLYNVP